MKNLIRKSIYLLCGILVITLLVVSVLKLKLILNDLEHEKAIKQTEQYLAENYHEMKYKIQDISTSNDFKHYGYFEFAITIQNLDTNEDFIVYYDKKMDRMEDSIAIKEQEEKLNHEITPKIEKYVAEHFGETRYISVDYDVRIGKPLIVVTFNKNKEDITQSEFNHFLLFLKEKMGIDHANVIVKYWTRELTFHEEF